MSGVTNREVAAFLEELSVLMELRGENPFRIRAYTGAARTIDQLDEEVEGLVVRNALTSVKGIGKGLAELVAQFVETGTAAELEGLRNSIPSGLLDMLRIQGLGPRKIRAIHDELGIDTLEALEQACQDGRLGKLSGFGRKTQKNILTGIARLRQYQGRHRIDVADQAARSLGAALAEHPHAVRLSVAGSLRRCRETVGDVDLVLSSEKPADIARAFAAHPTVKEGVAREKDRITVLLTSGLQADLRIVPDEQFPTVLHHVTGSEEHRLQLQTRAQDQGLRLDERGLFRGEQPLPCADEAALFAALGLDYIPPELREGRGEIQAAAKGELPRLVAEDDIRGMLHVHTTYSDGTDSLEAMALAVRERGYQYLGIADHSRSAPYAGGLQEDDVRRQHEEIDRLNDRSPDFRLFKGIESDILADGSLDYDDAVLETFDFVVVSVHSRFRMGEEEMTRRLIRAIEHPATTILGHLTGRLLLEREGYAVDVDAIIDAAAARNVALEINAHPQRLDADWRHLKKARDRGVKIAVNIDAHRIAGLDHQRYGIGIARKGWLRPEDVINTLDPGAIAANFRGAT